MLSFQNFIVKVFLVILLLAGISPAQLLNNRIAVAHSRSSGPGTQPVLIDYGTHTDITMKAEFKQDSSPRACWDFSINVNLVQCAGVRLRLLCKNPQAASQYNIYLKLNATWYSATFTPARDSAWESIFIPKTDFMPEGNPQSWAQCSTMRLAAWKGAPGTVNLHLAEVEFVRPNINIALLRSGTTGKGCQEAYRFAKHLNDTLVPQGLRVAVIEDADCLTTYLKPYAFAFIPSVKDASPQQIDAIANMLKRGTKAGVFYTLPPIVSANMNLPNTPRFTRSSSLPVPLVGIAPVAQRLPYALGFRQNSSAFLDIAGFGLNVDAWWTDASGKPTSWPAVVENHHGFWMTHVYLNQDTGRAGPFFLALTARFMPNLWQTAATTILSETQRIYQEASAAGKGNAAHSLQAAQNLFASQQYPIAIQFAQKCQRELQSPSVKQTPPPANEFRAFWCRSASGLPGSTWQNTAALLKKYKFTAVFPNVATPYSASYPSSVLPRSPAPAGNSLIACLVAAKQQGLQVHAWVNCLNAQDAPDSYKRQMKQADRLQKDAAGNTVYWLCPSLTANRQQLVKTVQELAKSYNVDGIHLDLIRFPSSQACFCQHCRRAFEYYRQAPVANWPADVLAKGYLRTPWLTFRQQLISSLVTECTQAARAVRPTVKLSAAVFPDLESARKTVAQNWGDWFYKGGLDFICPMNYRAADNLFLADVQRQSRQLGTPLRIVPGIGVSSERLSLEQVQRQINAARSNRHPGFILFHLGSREAGDILPHLAN